MELELVFLLIPTSTNINALLVQDVQGDSMPEILYGDGQWGYVNCIDVATGLQLWSVLNPTSATNGIAIADFDQDGEDEIAWGTDCGGTGRDYLVFHSLSDQSFEWENKQIDGPFHTVETGDVDGDGQIELVTVSIESNDQGESGILTIYDAITKAIEFRSDPFFLDGAGPIYAMEIADYADDDDMDIIIAAGHPHAGKFWIVDGNTHAIEIEYEYSNTSPIDEFYCFAIDDIDGDNVKEFIAAGDNFVSVINSVDFSVEWSLTIAASYPKPTAVLVGNIDADPEKEIVLCKGLLRTYDNGSYQEALSVANNFSAITLFDWNGSGPLEIIAGNSLGQVKIINGATLTELQSFQIANASINAIEAFDLNKDGQIELVITAGSQVYFLRMDGTLVQSNAIEAQLGMYDALNVSDYDNDGKANIIIGAARGVVELNATCTQCPWFHTSISTIGDNPQTPQADGSIVLISSGGTAPYSYLWNDGNLGSELNGLAAGTYSVQISDAQACSLDTTVEVGNTITGISEDAFKQLVLKPNPTNDFLLVSEIQANDVLIILDTKGRLVNGNLYSQFISNGAAYIDVSALKSGPYLIKVVSDSSERLSKFIKL